jgi:exodeoxyribonuclease VII small subunit
MAKASYPKDFNYQQAQEELNQLLDWFESGENDLAGALEKYQKAEQLLNYMESYLNDTEASLKIAIKNLKT